MNAIGLVAAMSQEIRPLLRLAGGYRHGRLERFRIYRFQLAGFSCILVKTGVGLKAAAEATRLLVASVAPRLLVSFGIAGSLHDDLRVGDVVFATGVWRLKEGKLQEFRPLWPLADEARRAASDFLRRRESSLFPGTIITTPGTQAVTLGDEKPVHPVLDMETAAVAEVAARAGIPLIALRSISDTPSEPLPFDLEALTGEDYRPRLGRIAAMILRDPGILARSFRLKANAERASANMAGLLNAAFGAIAAGSP